LLLVCIASQNLPFFLLQVVHLVPLGNQATDLDIFPIIEIYIHLIFGGIFGAVY